MSAALLSTLASQAWSNSAQDEVTLLETLQSIYVALSADKSKTQREVGE
jgi:hypothetical protein